MSIWHEGVALALVAAWPDDPLVEQLYIELQRDRQVSATVGYAVLFAKLPVNALLEQLRRQLSGGVERPERLGALHPAIAQRLARDPEARTAVAAALQPAADPSLKASVPRLLVSVGALTGEVRSWCSAELLRQADRAEGSEIGFDLVAEQTRAVPISLQETLAVTPG